METENRKGIYVAAIELGSSRIVGAVGFKTEQGELTVLAIESESLKDGVIRRGWLKGGDETIRVVTRIISKLENRIAPVKISGVYVGVAGYTLMSRPFVTDMILQEDWEISKEMVEEMISRGWSLPQSDETDLLDVIPTRYFIDNEPVDEPVGKRGARLKMEMNLILARHELKADIEHCFERRLKKSEVVGYKFTALTLADVVLSEEDRNAGCMLVDFGADTTMVSIYRQGKLRQYYTLPIGGNTITRDITTLGISDYDADSYKKSFGSAKYDPNEKSNVHIGGNIDPQKFLMVTATRCEELVENIAVQMNYASCSPEDLAAGIIVVGAGAQMRNLVELLGERTGMAVKKGVLNKKILYSEAEKDRSANYPQVVGLLSCGIYNCCIAPVEPEKKPEEKKEPEEEKKKGTTLNGKIGKFFGRIENIFGEDDE